MIFLNNVYELLNLTASVSTQVNSNQKTQISISSKKIGKLFSTYLLIGIVITAFYILLCIPQKLSINFFGLFKIKVLEIGIINFIICTIYALIKHYIFFKTKEAKPINTNIYNRDLPSNLTPAHVRLLVYDGVVDSQSIAATILDLVDRGYLKLQTPNRESLFSDDIYIERTNKSNHDLFTYEKYLLNWFFKDDKVSSKMLHQQLDDETNNPSENFSIFQGLILLSFPLDKYYKKVSNKKQRMFYLGCIISFFLYIFIYLLLNNLILNSIIHFMTLFGFANLLLASPTYVLNNYGIEITDCYMDLKRYLNEFSLIHEKSSDEIVLWNFYLSYSVALGINGVASKEIESFFGKNIYKLNINDNYASQDGKFIGMIPEIINEAKQIYNIRV